MEVTRMSKAGVEALVKKAMADETFRGQLKENPDAAIRGYDLTPEEIAAIKSRDATKLASWGLDERVTKSLLFED
jgi:hypothetical protein